MPQSKVRQNPKSVFLIKQIGRNVKAFNKTLNRLSKEKAQNLGKLLKLHHSPRLRAFP